MPLSCDVLNILVKLTISFKQNIVVGKFQKVLFGSYVISSQTHVL